MANLTLYSAGSGEVVIVPWVDADTDVAFFRVGVGGALELRDLTLRNGRSTDSTTGGGAISLTEGGSATLEGVVVENCSAEASGGAISVQDDASLLLLSATISGCSSADRGGAIFASGSTLDVRDSTISGCDARLGGGIAVFGTSGESGLSMSLLRSTVSSSRASERGGLLYAAADLKLLEQTALQNGSAGVEGAAVYVDHAEVIYELPTRPGYWLPNAYCTVYREAYEAECPVGAGHYECQKARDECVLEPDSCTFSEDGHSVTCHPPDNCSAATFVQPCDWRADASILGRRMYQLPSTPVDDDLPLPCAPGILGSADVEGQSSIECAGECPAGSKCPEPATHDPLPCDAGAFCPAGTIVPHPCPDGTFSNATNLTSAGECLACPAGSYCVAGVAAPAPCAAGHYGDTSGAKSATCSGLCASGYYCLEGSTAPNATACPAGTYNAYEGGTSELEACTLCPLGHYCHAGTVSPVECPMATTARAAGFGVEMITECTCQAGWYLDESDADPLEWSCELCPDEGANCSEAASLSTLPVELGWWRLTNSTPALYECEVRDGVSPCLGGCSLHFGCCEEGHAGPVCEVCVDEDHYFDWVTASCRACPSLGGSIGKVVGLVLGLALLFGGLAWTVRSSWLPERQSARSLVKFVRRQALMWRQAAMTGKAKILLSTMQLLWAAPYVYRMSVPPQFDPFLDAFLWLADFSFDVFLPGPCYGSALSRLAFAATWPFCLLAAWGGGCVLYEAFAPPAVVGVEVSATMRDGDANPQTPPHAPALESQRSLEQLLAAARGGDLAAIEEVLDGTPSHHGLTDAEGATALRVAASGYPLCAASVYSRLVRRRCTSPPATGTRKLCGCCCGGAPTLTCSTRRVSRRCCGRRRASGGQRRRFSRPTLLRTRPRC